LEKRGKRYQAEKPRQELSREKYEIRRGESVINLQLIRQIPARLFYSNKSRPIFTIEATYS
jgi:hypothetical protein